MGTYSINTPFVVFPDVDGDPLKDGYIYIGAAGLNAEVNPIQAYWDSALSIPAAQPVRTIDGFPSRSGTPGRLFVNADDYSILVRNKNSSLVYSSLYSTEKLPRTAISDIPYVYDTVASLKLSSLAEGSVAMTRGYNAIGDGGAATYDVKAPASVDTYGSHTLANSNIAVVRPANGGYDARTFGAFSGGANYGANLQALIDHVSGINAEAILVDDGAPYTTSELTLKDNLVFRGVGTAPTLFLEAGENSDILRGSSVDNIDIENLILDGNKVNNVPTGDKGQGIHVLKGTNINLRRVRGNNCYENGFRLIGVQTWKLEQCTAYDSYHNGFFTSGHVDGTQSQYGQMSDCLALSNGTDGFNIENDSRDIVLANCLSITNGIAYSSPYPGGDGFIIYADDSTDYVQRVTLDGCQAFGNYANGFSIHGAVNVTLSDVMAINNGLTSAVGETEWGHGIRINNSDSAQRRLSEITVDGAVLQGNGKHGVSLALSGTASSTIYNPVIRNITSKNNSQIQTTTFDGINIDDTDYGQFENIVAYDSQGTPTQRYGTRVESGANNPVLQNFNGWNNVTENYSIGNTTSIIESPLAAVETAWNPSISAGGWATTTVTIPYVENDWVFDVTHTNVGGNVCIFGAARTAANTVTVFGYNPTGGVLNLTGNIVVKGRRPVH